MAHPVLGDDPEALELDREEANIHAAEAAYRANPKLARDLEETGWFAERTQAAREGRTIWSEGRRQAEPDPRHPAAGAVPGPPVGVGGLPRAAGRCRQPPRPAGGAQAPRAARQPRGA
jgi:hypothetical protein